MIGLYDPSKDPRHPSFRPPADAPSASSTSAGKRPRLSPQPPAGHIPLQPSPPPYPPPPTTLLDPLASLTWDPDAPPPPPPNCRPYRPDLFAKLTLPLKYPAKFYAIPAPRLHGTSLATRIPAETPYITSTLTWASLTASMPFNGGLQAGSQASAFISYGQALAKLHHEFNHAQQIPDTLCLLCLTHHLPTPCPYGPTHPPDLDDRLLSITKTSDPSSHIIGPCPRCFDRHTLNLACCPPRV